METSIQLTPLRSFVMVAELGSFAEVARVLGYTEPAVHMQIAGLKKLAGGELFFRADRRMQLTELGARLLPHAQEALAAIQRISTEIGTWRATEGHLVRVGLGRSSGTYLFPFVAAAVARSHPEILLQPSIMPLDEIMENLEKGGIDIAVITGLRSRISRRNPGMALTAAPLVPYLWTLVGVQEFLLRQRGAPCETKVEVFIPDYAATMQGAITEHVRPFAPAHTLVVSPNAEAAKANALAGRGLAYVPEYVSKLEVTHGDLVHCLPRKGRQRSTIDIGHTYPAPNEDIGRVVRVLRPLRHILMPEDVATSLVLVG